MFKEQADKCLEHKREILYFFAINLGISIAFGVIIPFLDFKMSLQLYISLGVALLMFVLNIIQYRRSKWRLYVVFNVLNLIALLGIGHISFLRAIPGVIGIFRTLLSQSHFVL